MHGRNAGASTRTTSKHRCCRPLLAAICHGPSGSPCCGSRQQQVALPAATGCRDTCDGHIVLPGLPSYKEGMTTEERQLMQCDSSRCSPWWRSAWAAQCCKLSALSCQVGEYALMVRR